jgi:hypothetical protein
MWYNVESGEHRWELPLDGAVLRHALRSASKGERSSCCATDDVCANAWVSCVTEAEGGTVDTERKAALEVWMARTGNDMSEEELAMRTTGVAIFTDIAHSLPFTCPVGKWPAEAYGASAADAQLLRLRAADASSSPPPSNDPLWRRCARGEMLQSDSDYIEYQDGGQWGKWFAEHSHALLLPTIWTAGFDRALEWKLAPARPAASSKTWRCFVHGWGEGAPCAA